MAYATTILRRQSRIFFDVQSYFLPPWPNAEQCCSDPALEHPEAGKNCWIAQRDAATVCLPIEQQIMRCLVERERDLYKGRKSSPAYRVKCYMAGSDKRTSRLVAVIACKSRSFGRRIQEIIEDKDNTWWLDFRRENPAFGGFLHFTRQPSRIANAYDLPTQMRAYIPKDPSSSFGVALFTYSEHNRIPSRSTLGGLIVVDNEIYGMTVSHVLSSNITDLNAASESCSDSEESSDESSQSAAQTNDISTAFLSYAEVSADKLCCSDGEYTMLGNIHSRSSGSNDDALDWALVKLTEAPKSRVLRTEPGTYANVGVMPENAPVTVFLVQNGRIVTDGILSATPSLLCLPGSRSPMLLYSIVTSDRLRTGDCGMWVFDDQGDWYGHIIAGEPGSNIVYIAAAKEIIEDVKKQCNAETIQVFEPKFSSFLPGGTLVPGTDPLFGGLVTVDNEVARLDSHTDQLADTSPQGVKDAPVALGKPSQKRSFACADLSVVAISLICLALAYLTVTPRLSIAWQLQYSGQIVIIGLLLSIMNICMITISSYSSLLLEARFGPSRLQNYEAILTNKILKPHVSLTWRAVLVFLTFLPIGLSIAYKRALHGTATVLIPSDATSRYGIDFPQVSDFAPTNDPIYNFVTSVNPFQVARTRHSYPLDHTFPVAYGYNTLLLSNTSAVVLDTPVSGTVKKMQSVMKPTESWRIHADVNAYMASYNACTSVLRDDDAFWSEMLKSYFVDMNLRSYEGSHNTRIGTIYSPNNSQVAFGVYEALYNSTNIPNHDLNYIDNPEDPNILSFRATASLWDIQRVGCHGYWYVNKTSINLMSGSCDPTLKIDQSVLSLNGFSPYQMDTLPIYGHLFSTAARTPGWPWLNATYAVSLATAHWATAVYRLDPDGINLTGFGNDQYYRPMSEVIMSSRNTLNATGWLYLIVAIQPLITVLAAVVVVWLRDVPLGKGFGVIALLSGFDASTSWLIDGAALSGNLKLPVNLEIIPDISDEERPPSKVQSNHDSRIQYRLVPDSTPIGRSRLRKFRTYW